MGIVACRWLRTDGVCRRLVWEAALRRGDGRALPERGPALLLNIWLRRDAAHVSMRVGVRQALPQRTFWQGSRTKAGRQRPASDRSPGVAETSLRSGTRLEGRRPELFKSADRARTCNQTLPQASPRHVCGSGGATRHRLDNDLSIPAARRTPEGCQSSTDRLPCRQHEHDVPNNVLRHGRRRRRRRAPAAGLAADVATADGDAR